MIAYYNEIEPYTAQWLDNLIQYGNLPYGDVDVRDVRDVEPSFLHGYSQVHLFAGVGGWPYALRLAGWPEDREVWTGSCPCQPFSTAGRGAGFADERHLWPAMFHLICQRHPSVVFGEQVASPDGLRWLDLVRNDLEGENYAFASFDLCAPSVGAPHIRQRLYWVADSNSQRRHRLNSLLRSGQDADLKTAGSVEISRVADSDLTRSQRWVESRDRAEQRIVGKGGVGSAWANIAYRRCADGKSRPVPVEPEFFPLADGAPGRVGQLRAYGNAIVPQVAAHFIRSYVGA